MKSDPTYVFDNGKVYTMVDGRVVSSVKESDFDDEHTDDRSISPNYQQPGIHVEDSEFGEGEGPGAVVDWDSLVYELQSLGMDAADAARQFGTVHPDQYQGAWSQLISDLQDNDVTPEEFAATVKTQSPPETQMPDPPKEIQDDLMAQNEPNDVSDEDFHRQHQGSRVSTPNGLKGKVLGRVSGMWGDEVTVRFDNGRIVRLPVNQDLTFESASREASESPVVGLNSRLAADYDGSKDSLRLRVEELKAIKLEAGKLVRAGASYDAEQELDQIRVQADFELGEVHAALEHLADKDIQAFEPPAPFRTQVVEQEHVGAGDSSWLSHTVDEMIAEAEGTDYEKLMDEGPEAFTAGMEGPALADSGVTREVASSFIRSKTAAASPEVRDQFEQVWLSRVEGCRKAELLNRKKTTKKQAAVEEDSYKDLPDDILFT